MVIQLAIALMGSIAIVGKNLFDASFVGGMGCPVRGQKLPHHIQAVQGL